MGEGGGGLLALPRLHAPPARTPRLPPLLAPRGDTYNSAIDLDNPSCLTLTGDTTPYTDQYLSKCYRGSGPDMVYKWTAPYTGNFTWGTCAKENIILYFWDEYQTELSCFDTEQFSNWQPPCNKKWSSRVT